VKRNGHKKPKLTGERLRKRLARAASDSIMQLPKNVLIRVVKESDETRGRVAFRIMLGKDSHPSIQAQASFEQRVLVALKPIKL
jgi:hypothetical protein